MDSSNLHDFYSRRVAEYEDIYRKPERQQDLTELKKLLRSLFQNRNLLEVACGTGYWTEVLASVCSSILATDENRTVLDVARSKNLEPSRVSFSLADAYKLGKIQGSYDAGFGGFWWSHIPRERLSEFLASFHQALQPGAHVCFIDNRYIPGSSTAILNTDSHGNTYQKRVLKNGRTYLIVKNFPTSEEMHEALGPWSSSIEHKDLQYYWTLTYELDLEK